MKVYKKPNLLNRAWFVWRVYEENSKDEIVVNKEHDYALGHSKLLGIFKLKSNANDFAKKVLLLKKT